MVYRIILLAAISLAGLTGCGTVVSTTVSVVGTGVEVVSDTVRTVVDVTADAVTDDDDNHDHDHEHLDDRDSGDEDLVVEKPLRGDSLAPGP